MAVRPVFKYFLIVWLKFLVEKHFTATDTVRDIVIGMALQVVLQQFSARSYTAFFLPPEFPTPGNLL